MIRYASVESTLKQSLQRVYRTIIRKTASPLANCSTFEHSLVPRPHGRRESGLVSTACACTSGPRKAWEFVFVCKYLIRICLIRFRIIEKQQVRKRFLCTVDMRKVTYVHRRKFQSSHNPTSLKRAAEYLGRPSEQRIRQKSFAATFCLSVFVD